MRVTAATREMLPFFDQPISFGGGKHGLMSAQVRALDQYVGKRKHLEIVRVIEDEAPDFLASDCFVIDISRDPADGELALYGEDGQLFVAQHDGTFLAIGRVAGHLRNQLARNPFRNAGRN